MKASIVAKLAAVAGAGMGEFDSLLLMKLIIYSEKEFDVSFSRKDFSSGRLRSLDALAELIERKLQVK